LRLRWATCITAASVACLAATASVGLAAAPDPPSLAGTLQREPVQSIGVPRSSFTSLSGVQISALRGDIGRLDPGRIWILVVPPRSQSALRDIADPVFGDLPAGTLIAVAEDPKNPESTNFWVGSSWQSSDAAQTELNNVIDGFHKGQGSLFDDLRLEITSFASGDAAARHPPLSSHHNGSQTPGGGSGNGGLIALVVVGAIVLLAAVVFGVPYLRGTLRSMRRRREERADARQQASADFGKLAEKIDALDIDSSMPSASTAGKDEYAKALDCYQEAERRLRQPGNDYQFERALDAIKHGLEHVHNAERLFNPTTTPSQ
jgi:hypothetical protein